MLRPIGVLVGLGLSLSACSGGGSHGQGGGSGAEAGASDAPTCDGGCPKGQVCGDGECRLGCDFSSDCDAGELCRDGACYPVVCGDSKQDRGEECDNGDRNGDDAACTSDCHDAVCGDGLVRADREECDEGADNSDDGACGNDCKTATCGDGLVWAGHEECDEGPNNADDGACSTECLALQPIVDPNAASGLGWEQGQYTSDTTAVATWTPGSSAAASAQELQLFADESCTDPIGDTVELADLSTARLDIPVVGEGTYTFQVTTHDRDVGDLLSACSPPLVVDTTPPSPATALGFVETSPHDTLTVHGTWTLSTSPDIGSQSVQLFGGGVCASTIGMPVAVGSTTAEQFPLVTPSNATYSFKVITTDLAGNSVSSACSSSIQTSGGLPYTVKFAGDFIQPVVQVRADPKNAATLYVSLMNGEIHKSTNSGANWTVQCKSSNIEAYGTSYGHIVVSPDGTAYATGHTQFARVEALGGEEYPTIIDSSAAWASYYHSNRLAIDSTGKLYTWTFVGPGGLVSSINQGASYSVINTTASLFNSMEVDPFDDKHLVAVHGSHSTDPVGIYNSTDSGVSWTQIDGGFENYGAGVHFNPAAKGWIYLGSGHYSKDGGLTWADDAAYTCLEVDAKGAGYRLTTSAGGVRLERAPDMTAPAWANLHTFSGVQANLGVSMVSVVGSTIAVVLEGRLYVSSNSGTTFTGPVKFAIQGTSLTASSIVAHGALVYAAANGRIFKSTDSAQNWSEVYTPNTPLDSDTELHLNPGVTAQLVARPESWNSTYDERVDVTLDGGASFSTTSDCCYSWAGVLALAPANASRMYYFGWEPRVSTNGGLSFTEAGGSGQLVWYPWPAAYVNPANSNRAWYGDDAGRLYEYDYVGSSDTNITARLPFTDPAGIDMVKVEGVWNLRIISTTGKIAISLDNGATFSLVAGSGGLPAAARRIFVSHPDTPSLIATAAVLGDQVAYSPTLGASWVQTTLDSCDIRSLALTDGQLLIPCDNGPAMGIAAP
jgi:hypothetical protein